MKPLQRPHFIPIFTCRCSSPAGAFCVPSVYKTARWQRLRQLQLREHPLCAFCLERGHITAANVVDHVELHRGDCSGSSKLQSLREPAIEQPSGRLSCADIAPTSASTATPNHPFNRIR